MTLPQAPLWLILVAFVCALGPIVFFHELGHYLVARWFGIPSETFSIGFGREVFGWTDKQGTRWKVGWLPLGGYVRFLGDMTPASNPGDLEHVPEHLRDRIFQTRPVWQRFLVVLAGPAANFLLAILIFAFFFSLIGAPTSNIVGAVKPDTPAAKAGIQAGDKSSRWRAGQRRLLQICSVPPRFARVKPSSSRSIGPAPSRIFGSRLGAIPLIR